MESPSAPENIFQSLPAQSYEQRPESVAADSEIKRPISNKIKRTRLLLDARIELTDEELKVTPFLPLHVFLTL
jgi:hypothetical protein